MPSTLAQLEARVSQFLYDAANAVFPTTAIDEGLRLALAEYSLAAPLTRETVITLPGDGREIALNNVTGLTRVTDVWWPYDSADSGAWPPNRPQGFRLWWDDAQPVLFLNTQGAGQPQLDDKVRLFYASDHTIQNLDSADITTPPLTHESMLVLGAAGFAALGRAMDLNEDTSLNTSAVPNYAVLSSRWLREFRKKLTALAAQPGGHEPWGAHGWSLDKWDV